MGELGIISIALAEKMSKASGLRNRLAHEYNGIDEKKIFEAVKVCLQDLPEYMNQVNNFLNKYNAK